VNMESESEDDHGDVGHWRPARYDSIDIEMQLRLQSGPYHLRPCIDDAAQHEPRAQEIRLQSTHSCWFVASAPSREGGTSILCQRRESSSGDSSGSETRKTTIQSSATEFEVIDSPPSSLIRRRLPAIPTSSLFSVDWLRHNPIRQSLVEKLNRPNGIVAQSSKIKEKRAFQEFQSTFERFFDGQPTET